MEVRDRCDVAIDVARWSDAVRSRRGKRETADRQENSVEVLMVLDYSIFYR